MNTDINIKNSEHGEVGYTCVTEPKLGWASLIEKIQKQYARRIEYVRNSERTEGEIEKEVKQLSFNATVDPRRPDIFYNNKETAQRKGRIANRLNSISDDEFLTASYVLSWSTSKPDVWIGYYYGDITDLEVDAIVNAANHTLLGGGGVDGAIHRAAGLELREECLNIRNEKYPFGLPTGEAVITKGYNLAAEYVIHTPGPVWMGGNHREAELLLNCYYNSLTLAVEHNIQIIAFPEISTGAYGYPKQEAKKVAISAIADFVKKHPASLEEIILVSLTKETP